MLCTPISTKWLGVLNLANLEYWILGLWEPNCWFYVQEMHTCIGLVQKKMMICTFLMGVAVFLRRLIKHLFTCCLCYLMGVAVFFRGLNNYMLLFFFVFLYYVFFFGGLFNLFLIFKSCLLNLFFLELGQFLSFETFVLCFFFFLYNL